MKDARQSVSMTRAQKDAFAEVAKQRGISFNEFALEAMSKFVSNEDVEKHQTYNDEVKQLKLEILRAQKRKLEAEARIKEEIAQRTTPPPPPSASAAPQQTAPQQQPKISNPILHTEGNMQCVTCGYILPLRAYGFQQADDYANHVRDKHRRDLYPVEKEACLELANKEVFKK